jgi:hypothetical protein
MSLGGDVHCWIMPHSAALFFRLSADIERAFTIRATGWIEGPSRALAGHLILLFKGLFLQLGRRKLPYVGDKFGRAPSFFPPGWRRKVEKDGLSPDSDPPRVRLRPMTVAVTAPSSSSLVGRI